MYKQHFGIRRKMRFDTPDEYYKTLGFLAKSDGSISLVWENNEEQGAWGSEGRIHCHSNLDKITAPLKRKFTKGRGKKVRNRINCNEFVSNLLENHAFNRGAVQNYIQIKKTIPSKYQTIFDSGYNL